MMATAAMDERAPGSGEQIERHKRRRRWLALGLLALLGMAVGMVAGRLDKETVSGMTQWPQAAAVGLAALYLLVMGGGQWLSDRSADELERHRNARSMVIGAYGYMSVYPVWYALWRGGFVPEPDHQLLFLIFVVSLLLGAILARFR